MDFSSNMPIIPVYDGCKPFAAVKHCVWTNKTMVFFFFDIF